MNNKLSTYQSYFFHLTNLLYFIGYFTIKPNSQSRIIIQIITWKSRDDWKFGTEDPKNFHTFPCKPSGSVELGSPLWNPPRNFQILLQMIGNFVPKNPNRLNPSEHCRILLWLNNLASDVGLSTCLPYQRADSKQWICFNFIMLVLSSKLSKSVRLYVLMLKDSW